MKKRQQQKTAPVMPCLCRAAGWHAARDRSGGESNETQRRRSGTRDSKESNGRALLSSELSTSDVGVGVGVGVGGEGQGRVLGVAGREVGDGSNQSTDGGVGQVAR